METLIIQPKTAEQLRFLKAFLTTMKIDFKADESCYDPEFVKMILRGCEDIENGKGVK